MFSISLPQKPKYNQTDENVGLFVIEGCHPGYGTTIGNSIRRALLSSLEGSAPTSIKIKGITHEFTTIKGVKEDMVQVLLNLKKVNFKLHEVEKAVVKIKVKGGKGEKEIIAGDIECPSSVEIANKEHFIATLTSSSAEFEAEITVEKGLGYTPVEQQERREKEIGSIAIDAIFNPVERVNLSVENMRVGKRTDYERIILEIKTNGTITPEKAYLNAVEILMAQFNAVATIGEETGEENDEKNEKEVSGEAEISDEEEADSPKEIVIEELNFSTRTENVLKESGLLTVGEIAKKSEEELRELEGMGDKGIKEIKKAISKHGIILKASKN